ncbi:MAG: hypothetical protein IJS54_05765 [Desulfovibrio sp.]|nr:hypothetical protein [Desulfovibrio sp.]
MKQLCAYLLVLCLCGCAAAEPTTSKVVQSEAKGADIFNPWRSKDLPESRHLSKDGNEILGQIGGQAQSLVAEAKHRPYWRDEIYPVVFGERTAPHEILVLLDFANPKTEVLWKEVVAASKHINPKHCKIVVFGKSTELYGTDLIGLAIWMSHQREGQAMPYISYALAQWNKVKAEQKRQGRVKAFANEYDATASAKDMPILYSYLGKIHPPVAERDELALSRYSYDAGNVNMYQAIQVCDHYEAKPPCVVVDGRTMGLAKQSDIVNAVGK